MGLQLFNAACAGTGARGHKKIERQTNNKSKNFTGFNAFLGL
jgi:hypothetical protein